MDVINSVLTHVMGMPFLVGAIFCITGLITYVFPPKKINHLYGYRTSSSMKSKEVWDFAQRFSSIKMVQMGLLLIVISSLKWIIDLSIGQELIVSLISLSAVILFLFFSVERAIKKKFSNSK